MVKNLVSSGAKDALTPRFSHRGQASDIRDFNKRDETDLQLSTNKLYSSKVFAWSPPSYQILEKHISGKRTPGRSMLHHINDALMT